MLVSQRGPVLLYHGNHLGQLRTFLLHKSRFKQLFLPFGYFLRSYLHLKYLPFYLYQLL